MGRFLAGALACFLLVSGGLLMWQGRAQQPPAGLPAPPPMAAAGPVALPPAVRLAAIPRASGADAKSREQKRFARADKDKDGRITLAELVDPRRKAYARLDLNHDGRLSFEEWAIRTIDRFNAADRDRSRFLTATEYAATAPKPRAKAAACQCSKEPASSDQ